MSLSLEKMQSKFPEVVETFRGNGPAFVVNCWFPHRHGGVGQMEINPEGLYYCHNCGRTGNLYDEFPQHFVQYEEFYPWVKVSKDTVSVMAGSPKRTFFRKKMWNENVVAPGETVPLSDLDDSHPAIQYLSSRGFDVDEIRGLNSSQPSLGLYYCTKGQIDMKCELGTVSGRIVFPVYMDEWGPNRTVRSVLSGWQARMIDYVEKEDEDSGVKRVWTGFSWRKFKKVNGVWEDKYVPKYYTSPGRKRARCLAECTSPRSTKRSSLSRDLSINTGSEIQLYSLLGRFFTRSK